MLHQLAVITSCVPHLHTLGSVKKPSKILKLLHDSVIANVFLVPDHLPEVGIMHLLAQAVSLLHVNQLPQSMEVPIVVIGQIRSKCLDSAKGMSVTQSTSLLEMGNGINNSISRLDNSISCFENEF